MKKINKIVFVALLAMLMGCNDAIDIRQPGRLDAINAFQTVADLELGLLGVYNQWDMTPEIALASNFTDELTIGFDSGGQGLALYQGILTAGSAASSNFWVRNFRVNNRATILLEAAQLITPDSDDLAQYNDILAQVHFIRAYANFELLMYYSTNVRDDNTLAVPLIDFVAPLSIEPLRNTTGEIWDFINRDVSTASNLIQTQSNPFRISRDAINAFRARLALERQDYSTAETIAMQLLGSYGLANREDYQNVWFDFSEAGVIFKLDRTLNDSYDGQGATGSVNAGGWAGARFAFGNSTVDGSPYFEMERSVFNALDPDDIRFDVMVSPTSLINPDYLTDSDPVNTDILAIQKYPGSEGQPLMNDLKVFRSAEMLLIAAEARAYQTNFIGAATLIKQLRDARFGTSQPMPSYGSVQEAVGAVLDERKIELAYEGHRYRDLKRSGVAGGRGIDRDIVDCGVNDVFCQLPASDFRFTLPIPIVEINANPGIAEQQNPGY